MKAYKSTLSILWQECKLRLHKILSMIMRLHPVFRLIVFSLLYVAFVVVLILLTWEWLRTNKSVSNAELIRSIAIPVGAVPALFIAVWRSFTAAKQQRTDARGRLDERFQKGVEMLGSDAYIAKVGGVAILERLSKEHTGDFHVQVVEVLSGFITQSREQEAVTDTSNLEKALIVIGRRNRDEMDVYANDVKASVDLRNSNLDNFKLQNLKFENINFGGTSIKNAYLGKLKFTNVVFFMANLQDTRFRNIEFIKCQFVGAKFYKSDLVYTTFVDAIMMGANFSEATFARVEFVNLQAESANFTKARIGYSDLQNAILEDSDFGGAEMSHVNLMNANLKRVKFNGTDLVKANLTGADLLDANLLKANLSGANLTGVANLKQDQLDIACQSEGDEPILDKGFKWDKTAALRRHKKSRRR